MWTIKKSVIEDALLASQNCSPKEFMCFLGGNKKTQEIIEIVLLPTYNTENSASINFNVMPFDDEICGSLHSHPNGIASPSKADLAFFKRYHLNAIIGITNHSNCINFYNEKGVQINVKID